jgi:hypothetical protein
VRPPKAKKSLLPFELKTSNNSPSQRRHFGLNMFTARNIAIRVSIIFFPLLVHSLVPPHDLTQNAFCSAKAGDGCSGSNCCSDANTLMYCDAIWIPITCDCQVDLSCCDNSANSDYACSPNSSDSPISSDS